MKNTGVIRKIDDLGRIVIPKEIRKNLNIHNGEDVQIFIEEDKIILKKYQKILSIKDLSEKYITKLSKFIRGELYIIDKEKIVVSSNKNFINEKIDNRILSLLSERRQGQGEELFIGNNLINNYFYFLPIIIDADAVGGILLLSNSKIDDKTKVVLDILNILLSIEMC